MKKRLLPALLLTLVALQPAAAYDQNVALQAWRTVSQIEKQNGIPRGLLHSMSLVETGRGLDGAILPWPYTIGINSPTKQKYTHPQKALNDIAYWQKLGFTKFDTVVSGKNYGRIGAEKARVAVLSAQDGDAISVRAHNFAKRFHSQREAAIFAENLLAHGYKNMDVGLMQINWRYHSENFSSIYNALNPLHNANYAVSYLRSHDGNTWWKKVGRYHSGTQKHAKKYIDLVWNMYQKIHRLS